MTTNLAALKPSAHTLAILEETAVSILTIMDALKGGVLSADVARNQERKRWRQLLLALSPEDLRRLTQAIRYTADVLEQSQ